MLLIVWSTALIIGGSTGFYLSSIVRIDGSSGEEINPLVNLIPISIALAICIVVAIIIHKIINFMFLTDKKADNE